MMTMITSMATTMTMTTALMAMTMTTALMAMTMTTTMNPSRTPDMHLRTMGMFIPTRTLMPWPLTASTFGWASRSPST